MGERKIGNLNQVGGEPAPPTEGGQRSALVSVDYAEPTSLALILRDIAHWSGRAFVMEPNVQVRLQIFAPRELPPDEAYDIFLASLSVVGLRAVQVGQVVKIVAVNVSSFA